MQSIKIVRLWITATIILWTTANICGQLNLKIGYNTGIISVDKTNLALSAYQPTVGEISKAFPKLSYMHGISLGVRYKSKASAIELTWDNLSRDRSAVSYDRSTDSFDERRYDFSLNTLSLGADHYFGRVGVGTAVGRSTYRIQRPIGENDLSIDKENHWSARIHLSWMVQQSSSVSVVLRPYYQIALSDVYISGLLGDIGIKPTSDERPSVFGLSFLFYNGRQR